MGKRASRLEEGKVRRGLSACAQEHTLDLSNTQYLLHKHNPFLPQPLNPHLLVSLSTTPLARTLALSFCKLLTNIAVANSG